MNKKIKRLIAASLTLMAFSVISPVKYLNILSCNTAYASTDDDDDEEEAIENSYLDDLDVSEGDLNFSEKKTNYTVKIDSSNESIVVTAKAKNSTDKIKIDGSDVELVNKKASKTVKLDKGRNNIKIKVETEDYGIRTYNLIVNRGSASSSGSSSNDSDGICLDSINLSEGSILFSKERMSYNVNVNSSIDEIRITAQPEYDDYRVKIDGVSTDKDENYRRTVSLINGKNTILIHIEDEDENEQTYTLNIYRGGTTAVDTSEVIDNDQDPIYLDDIVIEDGDIPLKFKPKVTSYALDVKDDYDSIIIKAEPEYDDLVRINGSTCEDTFRKKVELKEGKNIITIKVNNSNTYDKDDDEFEERIYTVTVYRGTSEGTASGTQTIQATNQSSTIKLNQWINNNGQWQYNDSTGSPIKNNWFNDRMSGKSYYFQGDGNMVTGWLNINGNWYYFGLDGAMKTGWQLVNEKWYYLDSKGVMAYNTIIGGYKLSNSGAWIN